MLNCLFSLSISNHLSIAAINWSHLKFINTWLNNPSLIAWNSTIILLIAVLSTMTYSRSYDSLFLTTYIAISSDLMLSWVWLFMISLTWPQTFVLLDSNSLFLPLFRCLNFVILCDLHPKSLIFLILLHIRGKSISLFMFWYHSSSI